MSSGKITVELAYEYDVDSGSVLLTHPSLAGELSFRASSSRLAEVQLEALNLAKPKTPIQEIIADGQELLRAAQELRDVAKALRGR